VIENKQESKSTVSKNIKINPKKSRQIQPKKTVTSQESIHGASVRVRAKARVKARARAREPAQPKHE